MDAKLKEITSWELLCKAEGRDPNALPDVSSFPEEDREHTLKDWMLKHVHKFFRQGKPISYMDGSPKWSLWWARVQADEERPGGFGFSVTYFDFGLSGSTVGSRLCSHDEETERHIFTHFNDLVVASHLK